MPGLMELAGTLGTIPEEYIAGTLTTTSVPDRSIDSEQLRQLLTQHGLDSSLVPAKRPEVFDFQNACRSVETRRGVRAPKGHRTQITVGEVVTNSAESVYQITAEVRDETNRVIEHPKGMRVVYDKAVAQNPIRVEPLEAFATMDPDLEARVRAHFDTHRGKLPGAKVREILRTLFRSINATVWSKGVWFVGIQHASTLAAMEATLTGLYGTDSEFHTIPMLNTKGVKRILGEKVIAHVRGDAGKLMAEIGEQLSDGRSVSDKQFQRIAQARAALVEQADAMQATYGSELEGVEAALKLVDAQVMEMWSRVK
jgi:hypothetical protein